MKKITLRSISLPDHTIGVLSFDNFHCMTIELPDLDNQRNISCIPGGLYPCRKFNSPGHGLCFAIDNVTGRSDIRIHVANFVQQLLGCIAVGESLSDFNNDGTLDVTNSRKTLNKLLALLPDEFLLEIKRS